MEFNSDRYADLVYHDHASTDFGIAVKKPWIPIHPTPDETKTHVPGRNGDVWQTNNAFQNVTETFECVVIRDPNLYSDWFEVRDAISDWLGVGQGYDYLEFTAYPNWAFYAEAQPFTLTPTENDDFQATLSLPFDCSPMMTSIRGLDYKKLPESGVIINQTDFDIHPEWHIHGSGDFMLVINGVNYFFDDVENDIWLKSDGNAFEKDDQGIESLVNSKIRLANNDSPVFSCGKNTVSFQVPTFAEDGSLSKTITVHPADAFCEYKAMWKKVI